MKAVLLVISLVLPTVTAAQDIEPLRKALTFHASFDTGFDADFSRGEKSCWIRQGKSLVPCVPSADVQLVAGAGRFGGALFFPKRGATRPQFSGVAVLNYNAQCWSATVSVWLRLDPDKDLEPGYCDPVQIVGDDAKKGFIFLEWSKDETPRFFRYAVRPLFHIWNPTNVQWGDIPFEKRPMVQVAHAPFSHEGWTHVVFSFENINDRAGKSVGRLFINGQLRGTIENWDLTFDWKSEAVQLMLGSAYVGYQDDLAVFSRALTATEVKQLFALKTGVRELYPSRDVPNPKIAPSQQD